MAVSRVIPRPSNANRWAPPNGCPGSVQLEAQFPDDESEGKKLGIAAHELAKMCHAGTVITDPIEMIDRQTPNGIFVDVEMAEHVQDFLLYLFDIAPLDQWYCEQRLAVPSVRDDQTAIIDFWIALNGTLYVIEFKYGHGVVEVFENWQLLNNVVALMGAHALPVNTIKMIIYQPRGWHPDGIVRSWSMIGKIQKYAEQLRYAAHQADQPDPPIQTGKHCLNCKAILGCPAGRKATHNAIHVAETASLEEYTGETIAQELELFDHAFTMLKARKSAIETLAAERIKTGTVVPGWGMQRGQTKLKWMPGTTVQQVAALGTLMGVETVKTALMTPTQVKKAGVAEITVDLYSKRYETGVKLMRHDATRKAREVFGQ